MKKESKKRTIYNFFLKNWLVSTIISVVPLAITAYIAIWIPAGGSLVLQILFTALILVSILFTTLKFYFGKVDDEKRQNADKYYQAITERFTGIISDMTETIMDTICSDKYKGIVSDPIEPFSNDRSSLNPYRMIDTYCKELKTVLPIFFDAESLDIGLSIYVKKQEWDFLYQSQVSQRDLAARKVSESEDSTFSVVKDSPGMAVFKEKKALYEDHKYIPTKDEENNGINGTIYCKNISLVNRQGVAILPLVICVTTYQTPICDVSDVFAKDKAKKLLDKVADEIQYEIANLALYQHIGLRKEI